ncbi:MAG: hypothetical protein ACK5LN_04430 [Propioniciclava sp.]
MTHPVVNTHVHFPPNFSAFATVADAIQAAVAEGAATIGISNFFDQQVYMQFRDQAASAGVMPLYGLEFITLIDDLAEAGIRVNDPANPGRMYLCGKGIAPFKDKPESAAQIAAAIRSGNDNRAAAMVTKIADWFGVHGFDTGLTAASITAQVAARAQVPVAWVSLQERHIAMAFQEALAALPLAERAAVLERVYGAPAQAELADPGAVQAEIRSRLVKAGTPGFVAEAPLSFQEAYAYILDMDGIPTYPTLADGVRPLCPFEDPAPTLAAQLIERGIYAAELIPHRNTAACVDAYVRAFTEAGLIVMAGTEHNTPERIPFQATCLDGLVSESSSEAFWEGSCVVAAHQHEVAAGRLGYVDAAGDLTGDHRSARRAELVALGAGLIES